MVKLCYLYLHGLVVDLMMLRINHKIIKKDPSRGIKKERQCEQCKYKEKVKCLYFICCKSLSNFYLNISIFSI